MLPENLFFRQHVVFQTASNRVEQIVNLLNHVTLSEIY